MNLYRLALCIYFLFALLFCSSATSSEEPLKIHAIKTISASPQLAVVEITSSYDGSMGNLVLAATARSTDGLIRSNGYTPVFLPQGSRVRIEVKISAPGGLPSRKTDLLAVNFYDKAGEYLIRKKLDWQHLWPGVSQEPYRHSTTNYPQGESQITEHAFYALITEEDFASIDHIFDEWNAGRKWRDGDGGWRSEAYLATVSLILKNLGWQKSQEKIERWKAQNPTSIGACIAEVIFWISYAQSIKIDQYPESLKEKIEGQRRSRFSTAESVLINSRHFASSSPVWFQVYLDYLIANKLESRVVETIAHEGSRKHPTYLPIFFSRIKTIPSIQAKADYENAIRIVSEALTNTAATDGRSGLVGFIAPFRQQFLIKNKMILQIFSWPNIRIAMEDLNMRYPSTTNMNRFAEFACIAEDKQVYLAIRQKLKNAVVIKDQDMKYLLDVCDAKYTTQS